MTVTESPSSSERAVLTRRVLLLSRHAHEEYEHKGVAFDVFQTVSGSHRIRVGVMNAVTAAFIGGAVVVAALALLTGRSARNPRRPRRDPARIGRQGTATCSATVA
jgi:predicted metal-dependent hydrolase